MTGLVGWSARTRQLFFLSLLFVVARGRVLVVCVCVCSLLTSAAAAWGVCVWVGLFTFSLCARV